MNIVSLPNQEKLLIILDASAFSKSSCILRLFNITVLGLKSKTLNNDIEFGTAFHKFRKIFRDKGMSSLHTAVNAAVEYFNSKTMYVKKNKEYLTTAYLQSVCGQYAIHYQKDAFIPVRSGEIPLLECSFALPFYIDSQLEILVAGTMDEIGKWIGNGIYCIADAKVSAIWNTDEYFKTFELSPQLLFYRWILGKYAEAYPDSIYAKIEETGDVGCFIDGVFHKGAEKYVECIRSPVMIFKKEKIKEFDILVQSKVVELVAFVREYLKDSRFRPFRQGMLNGACDTKYGVCDFFPACAAVDEVTREIVIKQHYKQEFYNPLEHGK